MLDPDLVSQHRQDLRRGTTVLACLALLGSQADYGYALLGRLAALGLDVEGNTLYPLLRRLASQGLLTAEWNTDEARPRKFYRASPEGIELLSILRADWESLGAALRDAQGH